MITGKLYEYLKWLAQIVLPAVGALYLALASLWGLPSPQEVAGTILAIDTFLGVILGISQVAYGKAIGGGTMHVNDMDEKVMYNLELDDDPSELKNMKEVRFKVNTPGKPG